MAFPKAGPRFKVPRAAPEKDDRVGETKANSRRKSDSVPLRQRASMSPSGASQELPIRKISSWKAGTLLETAHILWMSIVEKTAGECNLTRSFLIRKIRTICGRR